MGATYRISRRVGAALRHIRRVARESLYDSPARPLIWRPPRFVIVGTGRCGTKYIARVLTTAGVRTGHEEWWNVTQRKTRGLCGDASWFAVFNLQGYSGRVFHQIRDPIKVIRSIAQVEVSPAVVDNVYGKFRARYVDFTQDPIHDAMVVVDTWLRGAEEVSEFTYRVEDLTPDLVVEMMQRVGLTADPARVSAAIASVSTNLNNKAHLKPTRLDLEWRDLPRGDLRDRLLRHAERFNYV